MNTKIRIYVDITDYPEDDRIRYIGNSILETGQNVIVSVDDELGKPERYVHKLLHYYPTLSIGRVIKGAVKGSINIEVGPPGYDWGSGQPE